MSVGASRRADVGAPTLPWTGLTVLAQVLATRYPDIKPRQVGEILHLHGGGTGPSRYLVWDGGAGTFRWYVGPDQGAHLKRSAVEAATQIAVLMGSVHA